MAFKFLTTRCPETALNLTLNTVLPPPSGATPGPARVSASPDTLATTATGPAPSTPLAGTAGTCAPAGTTRTATRQRDSAPVRQDSGENCTFVIIN
jgi:hypothetical protein